MARQQFTRPRGNPPLLGTLRPNRAELVRAVQEWYAGMLRESFPDDHNRVMERVSLRRNDVGHGAGVDPEFGELCSLLKAADLVGLVSRNDKCRTTLLFCRTEPVGISEYRNIFFDCRVLCPQIAIVVARAGYTELLHKHLFLHTIDRILEYDDGRNIVLAQWNPQWREIDQFSLFPRGSRPL
jgi:hypothetical protein